MILENTGVALISGPGLFTFAGTPLADGDRFTIGESEFQIRYDGGTGNDIVLQAVPESASVTMLLGSRRRRLQS